MEPTDQKIEQVRLDTQRQEVRLVRAEEQIKTLFQVSTQTSLSVERLASTQEKIIRTEMRIENQQADLERMRNSVEAFGHKLEVSMDKLTANLSDLNDFRANIKGRGLIIGALVLLTLQSAVSVIVSMLLRSI